MARPLRLEFSGAVYHVTARGDRQEAIFEDDEDRERLLEILGSVVDRFNWVVHAYCLMDNHYHFLIETLDSNLSKGMRQLNGVYTQCSNRRHNRVGHLFQGRYKAVLVQKEEYLLELSRYLVLNPVRARMVRAANEWPWSSYPATVGQVPVPDWLTVDEVLGVFNNDRRKAVKSYEQFVADGKNQPSPWDHLKNQIFLGDEPFVDQMTDRIKQLKQPLQEVPKQQRAGRAKPLSTYADEGISRNEAIAAAYASGGFTMKGIADYYGVHYSWVSRIVKNAESKRKT